MNILSPDSFSHMVFRTRAKVDLIVILTACFPSLGVKLLQMFATYLKITIIELTV